MTTIVSPSCTLSLVDAGLLDASPLASPWERYKVERALGTPAGGDAEYLLATDTRLASQVVLTKRSPRLLAAHNAELHLLRASAPHTARLIDTFFEIDGSSCIVRSFIPGEPLDRLDHQSVKRANAIAAKVAWLVHSLHTAKPYGFSPGAIRRGDLIVDADEQVWLIGCSKSTKLEADPAEQIALDIRATGLIMLSLLIREPFETSAGDLHSVIDNIVPEIAEVVRRSINVDHEKRYASMKWFAHAIEGIQAQQLQLATAKPVISLPPVPKPVFHPVKLNETPVAYALSTLQTPSLAWARLAQRGMLIDQQRKREPLCAIDTLDIDAYDHQIQAAVQVVNHVGMSAGAILADEVGLGKTVEALMICQELRARSLVESVLIVASPSGTVQWLNETVMRIRRSSHERGFRVYQSAKDAGYPLLIVSSATLKQERHRAQLLGRRYDLVIVDEAHRCCGGNGALSAFGNAVQLLDRKRLLLLTASPLGNRLWDLFSLTDLIRPGLLGSATEFASEYVSRIKDKADYSSTAAIRSLRARIQTLMIRHKRQELRNTVTPRLDFYIESDFENSSAAKVEKAAQVIAERWRDERVVVFASGAPDRAAIAQAVARRQPGRVVIQYLGNRKSSREFEAQFNDYPEAVIISNDAMAEGMNWQRARCLLQFDMPLTPLVWEQRIGRIYRLGQRAVALEILHLTHPDSSDAKVLDIYRNGLGLFTLPIGEASAVLDHIQDPVHRNIELLMKLLRRDKLSGARFEDLKEELSYARAVYDRERADAAVLDALYFGGAPLQGSTP